VGIWWGRDSGRRYNLFNCSSLLGVANANLSASKVVFPLWHSDLVLGFFHFPPVFRSPFSFRTICCCCCCCYLLLLLLFGLWLIIAHVLASLWRSLENLSSDKQWLPLWFSWNPFIHSYGCKYLHNSLGEMLKIRVSIRRVVCSRSRSQKAKIL